MKHHRLITRVPLQAQTDTTTGASTSLEVKMLFKIDFVDRMVVFVFQTFGSGGTL